VEVLRLQGGQVETLFDEALPSEVRELPEDLARLDVLLSDQVLLHPIEDAWAHTAREHGRPSIPMTSFMRLMVVKQRTGWGYETLVREVSDSLHLRRFCLIALSERVPDESTVRKLTRHLGCEVVDQITRAVITKATREARFRARAVRIDSTVVEADVRYPSDAVLALQGARALAREGRKLGGMLAGEVKRVVDRSRLLPGTVTELDRLSLRPREVALDGGFGQHKSREQLEPIAPERMFVSGREEPGSRRTRKRLARYRTGAEGRISHLKRGYGLRRSRLKGHEGQRTWTGWPILAYNLDTLAIQTG